MNPFAASSNSKSDRILSAALDLFSAAGSLLYDTPDDTPDPEEVCNSTPGYEWVYVGDGYDCEPVSG